MTKYEEVRARCGNCDRLEKCAEVLYDWCTDKPITEDIHCNHFSALGKAMQEYVKEKIYEMLKEN